MSEFEEIERRKDDLKHILSKIEKDLLRIRKERFDATNRLAHLQTLQKRLIEEEIEIEPAKTVDTQVYLNKIELMMN